MRKINLYKYNEDGRITITPQKRNEADEPALYRLVADENMKLKSGDKYTSMVDTYVPDEWTEITKEEYEKVQEELKAARAEQEAKAKATDLAEESEVVT